MSQIFVITAGNPEARQHLVESIENQIDEQKVFGGFAAALREELEHIRVPCSGAYVINLLRSLIQTVSTRTWVNRTIAHLHVSIPPGRG